MTTSYHSKPSLAETISKRIGRMNHHKLACLLPTLFFLHAAGAEEGEPCYTSPNQEFHFKGVKNSDDGWQGSLVSKAGVILAENLVTTPRYFTVSWEPSSKYFCISDHSDGHIVTLTIYKIGHIGTHFKLEKVYFTPDQDHYDQKWSLVKWDAAHGLAHLKVEYAVWNADGPLLDANQHMRGFTRNLTVMLDYLPVAK